MAYPNPLLSLDVLRPGRMALRIVGGGIETPRSLSGDTGAVAFGPGGLISLKYSDITLAGIDRWALSLYLSQLAAMLGSRVNTITVPIMTDLIAPTKEAGGPLYATSPFSDGTPFSDMSLHSQSTIQAKLYASASLYANPIQIKVTEGRALYGGEWLSFDHPIRGSRAYRIAWIDGDATIDGDGFPIYTVALEAPLKEAATAGDMVRFARPRVKMRLAPQFLATWDVSGFWMGTGELDFVEA